MSRVVLEASLSRPESELPQLERVHILTTLATDAGIGLRLPLDLDSAERYAKAAVALAEQLDAPVELSDALQALTYVYFARGMLPKQLATSRRRLALSHDPRFGDVDRRIAVLEDVCRELMLIGEYSQALRHLQEAESLATHIGAISRQVRTLDLQVKYLFRLDRWDEVLEVHEKCRELEQRHTPEQMGMICLIIAISAAVLALRGDVDQAKVLRKEAYGIMVRGAGGSPNNWGRTQHY
jgi:tetratricopeptide (TPR) repeat protein